MASKTNNPTRRETLVGIALCGATAAIAPATALALPAPNIDRNAWNVALAEYRQANAAFDEAIARHEQAEELAGAACPREGIYFDEYNLGMGTSRERVISALGWYQVSSGKPINAGQIADDFMAYQARHEATNKRFGVKALDADANAQKPRYFAAREALMAVPAPDTDALLMKFQIATISLDDEFLESALADANRLLGKDA